jgi:hypothetical protein
MDLGSVFLRFTEGRAMSRGADAYGAAQALEKLD